MGVGGLGGGVAVGGIDTFEPSDVGGEGVLVGWVVGVG